MTEEHKSFLKLVKRSGTPGEWCPVSRVVAKHLRGYLAANSKILQLVEVDDDETEGNMRVRFTDAGLLVVGWLT